MFELIKFLELKKMKTKRLANNNFIETANKNNKNWKKSKYF